MTRIKINLGEYSALVPTPAYLTSRNTSVDPRLQELSLSDHDHHLLSNELKDILQIVPLKDGLGITSFSHVGIASFSSFTVEVVPKIFMNTDDLFGMINYIFKIDDWKPLPNAEFNFKENEAYIIEIIILLFVEACSRIFKHGLYRSYEYQQTSSTYLKGKLLFSQNVTNQIKGISKFACEYDDLDYNNIENKILHYCLKISYSITKSSERKADIKNMLSEIEDVVEYVHLTPDIFSMIHYNRITDYYKPAHNLARIIMESFSPSPHHASTVHEVPMFFVDMNKIFEKFVAELFKEFYCPSKYTAISQKSHSAWIIDFVQKRSIFTDILLHADSPEENIVIDTKYKESLSDPDLYQLGFYIQEYSLINPTAKKRGYAILPKPREDMKKSIISAKAQKLDIIKSYIDLEYVVPLLSNKDKNFFLIQGYLGDLLIPPQIPQK